MRKWKSKLAFGRFRDRRDCMTRLASPVRVIRWLMIQVNTARAQSHVQFRDPPERLSLTVHHDPKYDYT